MLCTCLPFQSISSFLLSSPLRPISSSSSPLTIPQHTRPDIIPLRIWTYTPLHMAIISSLSRPHTAPSPTSHTPLCGDVVRCITRTMLNMQNCNSRATSYLCFRLSVLAFHRRCVLHFKCIGGMSPALLSTCNGDSSPL